MRPTVFYRDLIFYIGSYVILTAAVLYGSISVLFCAVFLGWYAIFIGFVAWEDLRIRRAQKSTREERESLLEEGDGQGIRVNKTIESDPSQKQVTSFEKEEEKPQVLKSQALSAAPHHAELKPWSATRMRMFFHEGIKGETRFRDKSLLQKIMFICLDAPFDFLRRISMPPPADDQWYRPFACIWPTFMMLLFFLTQIWDIREDSTPPISFYICIGVTVPIDIVLYLVTSREAPPKWSFFFSLFAFFGSILWLEFISDIVVDILGVFSLMVDVDPAYLGITFLAWGNSIGDMVANFGVAKRGLANMAIVGCFAGPFFNMCIGLGISMLIQNLGSGSAEFKLANRDSLLSMTVAWPLILLLLVQMVVVWKTRMYLTKFMAWGQIAFFVVIMVVTTVLAFTVEE